jgi:hypothetical protein
LDGVIGVKGIRDPIVVVVIRTACYLHFISYALALTALRVVGLYWWRLSSYVLSCVTGSVLLLGTSSIGDVVLCTTRGVTNGVGGWIGCCIVSDIGSWVDRLRNFVLASSLLSYGLKGALLWCR